MADKLAQWLEELGLAQYAQVFAANDIDARVLPHLSEDDLMELGVSLGHRRILQAALRERRDMMLPQDLAARAPHEVRTSPPAEAERRQITVLFCDLAGSTAMASRLDPEDMRDVLRSYQHICADVIQGFDGYIAKFMGDGVYAYFGYPHAHENDAERAIRASLGIVQALAALDEDLAVRIGVATGTVVVGDILGEGPAEEASVTGETPNLAARLQQVASPNAIVVAPATRALVGDLFAFEDLGVQTFKGIDAAFRVWRVTGEGDAETRFDAGRARELTPLTGRNEELGLILRRWELAKGGDGQTVVLSGEAGIGKSRLADALREKVLDEPHFNLRYQCSPHHANSALYPFIQRLERAAGIRRDDSHSEKLTKLETRLATPGEPGAETVSLLADLLSIPLDDRYPRLDLDPGQKKQRTLEALAGQVAALVSVRPVLFIFEDAHWADPTSLELLDRVIERAAGQRLMVLITTRPEFSATWADRAHTTFLTLNRLGRHDCLTMAEKVSGGRALPGEILEQVIARADGVPLFLEELIEALIEADAGDRRIKSGSPAEIAIPATLKESLMARLDRLGPAREVAQVAAVIGREFSHELLAAVAPPASGELVAALDRIVDSGLAFRRGTGVEAAYTFKHALVQGAAYDSLLRRRRAELHAKVAHALEERFPETAAAQPELLAFHFTEGGLPEPAARYWLNAAQAAFRASAMADVVAHATRGLAIVDGLDGSVRNELEASLYALLGLANKASKGLGQAETEAAFSRAYELSRGDAESPWLFPVLFSLSQAHWAQCQFDKAQAEAEELMRLAAISGKTAHQLVAEFAVGSTHLHAGRLSSALESYERVGQIYDPASHAALTFSHMLEFGVAYRFHLALAHLALGHPDQAFTWSQEAIAVARNRQPINLSAALMFGNFVYWFRGDIEALLASSEESVALGRQYGFTQSLAFSRITLGWALVHDGREEEGLAEIDEGIIASRRTGYTAILTRDLAVAADANIAAGRVFDALAMVNEGLTLYREKHERYYACPLLWTKGNALLAENPAREDEAERCFREAIDLARDQAAKSWELRASIFLARLWQSQGKAEKARALILPIHAWFTEGFDTADLKQAKALLGELG